MSYYINISKNRTTPIAVDRQSSGSLNNQGFGGRDDAPTEEEKAESTTTLDDEDFEEKFGFTKDLQIVDGEKALAHSKQYFFLMNGMNEYGNKVIDKEAYKDYLDEFEEYWEQHRDFFPYLDEKAARAKMIPEFTRHFYSDTFMPEFKKRLTDAKGASDKNKTLDELAAEGRNEFGEIVSKKYLMIQRL